MMRSHNRYYLLGSTLALIVGAVVLVGCAATQTAIKYSELDVQTQMSASIFLRPASPADRSAFLQIKNTSDKPDLDIAVDLAAAVQAKGYQLVADPNQAFYQLQVNVLNASKTSLAALDAARGAGFGGPLAGMAAGALVAGAGGGQLWKGMLVGGLVGGAAEVITGAMVKAVTFGVATDVQISERAQVPVAERVDSQLPQGTATVVSQASATTTGGYKTYQTRVISSATRVNLAWEEASPQLRSGLVQSISGLF